MVLYIFHIVIGFLVLISTIVMTFWFKTNRILNTYLIVVSIVLCAYLIFLGLDKLFNLVSFQNLNYYQVVLTLTPATYLFFQKLIFNKKFPERKDIYYFIVPMLIYFFVGKNYNLKWYRITQFIFFVLYLFFYIKIIFQLLKKHIWLENQINSFPVIVNNWASFIFKMMLIFLFHFFIVIISETFGIGNNYKISIELSLLIVFLIAYFKVISTPELLYGRSNFTNEILISDDNNILISSVWNLEINNKIVSVKDKHLNKIINKNIKEYRNAIEKIALIDFSFRNSNYSLNDLSIELGLPKYYIVYIFKYHCDLSFNEYKRLVRVYDSILLIQKGYLKNNTLNSLSEFVGFSSYNPYLLCFKKITGVSPYDYNKNRKLDCSLPLQKKL